jgi:hypothetical protein
MAYNRGKLLREAKAGKVVVVGSYHFDDMFGETNSKNCVTPVYIKEEGQENKRGYCTLTAWKFKTKSGCAYDNGNGVITLIVHSNCNYDFKVSEELYKEAAAIADKKNEEYEKEREEYIKKVRGER